jgi:hypothetical protein
LKHNKTFLRTAASGVLPIDEVRLRLKLDLQLLLLLDP